MPTGYTAGITETMPFNEFALKCARVMGALIMMRDDAMDAEIPKRFEPSDYHREEIEEAQSEKAAILEMTDSECQAKAIEETNQWNATCRKEKAGNESQERGYRRMLALVEAWKPTTPDHEGMKKFMAEQITDSIRFDCDGIRDYWTEKEAVTGPAWRASKLASLAHDIEYHTREYAAEVLRTEERNKWIDDLRKSLSTNNSTEKPA